MVAHSTIKLHSFHLIPDRLPHEITHWTMPLMLGLQECNLSKESNQVVVIGYLKLGLFQIIFLFFWISTRKMHAKNLSKRSGWLDHIFIGTLTFTVNSHWKHKNKFFSNKNILWSSIIQREWNQFKTFFSSFLFVTRCTQNKQMAFCGLRMND